MLVKSIKTLIKKSIKKQSKHLMLILIKMFLIFYTAEFYSLTDQLWLKIKKVADWMRCNIIYSKISQNSRAYKMKNILIRVDTKHFDCFLIDFLISVLIDLISILIFWLMCELWWTMLIETESESWWMKSTDTQLHTVRTIWLA